MPFPAFSTSLPPFSPLSSQHCRPSHQFIHPRHHRHLSHFPATSCRPNSFYMCANGPNDPRTEHPPASVQPSLTTATVNENSLSPMMRHYVHTRRRLYHSLCAESDRHLILLYRVGDFFESFFEDAYALSLHCGLALTSKDGGKALGCRVPMAGLPHFCLDDKVAILLANNVTVAVVDQISTTANKKSGDALVHRAVTRLLSPATTAQTSTQATYVAAVCVSPASSRASREGTQQDLGFGLAESNQGGTTDVASVTAFTFGFAYADACGGEFCATQDYDMSALQTLLATRRPVELIVTAAATNAQSTRLVDVIVRDARRAGMIVTLRSGSGSGPDLVGEAARIVSSFNAVDNVESLGCRGLPLAVVAAAEVIKHLTHTLSVPGADAINEGMYVSSDSGSNTTETGTVSLNPLTTFTQGDFLQLDEAALRNLEILESARDASRQRSLQWAVDRTVTCMGARRLRAWLLHPLAELNGILARHHAVDAFLAEAVARDKVQAKLRSVPDLERIAGRLASARITPRELRWLCESVLTLPSFFDIVPEDVLRNSLDVDCPSDPGDYARGRSTAEGHCDEPLANNDGERDELWQLVSAARMVVNALADPAPSTLPSPDSVADAGACVFRAGYNEALDVLRAHQSISDLSMSVSNGKKPSISMPSWMAELENRERTRSGIESLRVKHVRSCGYVLRLPRAVGERKMGDDELFFSKLGYERVQSTKVELRFTFAELRARARAHAVAVAEVVALERQLFFELCEELRPFVMQLRNLGALLACIDVVAGFATVADERGYVRPEIDGDHAVVDVEDVRHAVVEQMLPPSRGFVANTLRMGYDDTSGDATQQHGQLLLLCGPNAAGKSCALRSIGLTVVLAQAGSFVPARRARLGVSDRVFTRVGAVDDVANGQSTFQVEMAETACILSHAGVRSIVLLDEIGRGTSTADGIAIAWSVAEELSQRGGNKAPLSMFVTHFHELNHLACLYDNIDALHVVMQKTPAGDLVSTHVIEEGPSYESLGINTAQRAGFPQHVLSRARLIADIVSNPCQAVGQRLQLALTPGEETSENKREDEVEDVDTSPPPAEAWARGGSRVSREEDAGVRNGYERGFSEGYERALSDVQQAVQSLGRAYD